MVEFVFLTMEIPPVQEKEREKREKDKEGKEKDKKVVNGHLFTPVSSGQAAQCFQCNKAFNSKEAFHCTRKSLCLSVSISFSSLHCSFIPVFVLSVFVTGQYSSCFESN